MKIAIVLHLYYHDLWNEFKNKFLSIDNINNIDLYITLSDEFPDISSIILHTFPNAKIFKLQNKGLDIGPFLFILEYLKSNNIEYDYLIKLHTKKSTHIRHGNEWRIQLTDSILGNNEIFNDNIKYMESNSTAGMMGNKHYIYTDSDIEWILNISKHYGIVDIPQTSFVAGTMFLLRHKILINFFKNIDIIKIYNNMNIGYNKDRCIEHAFERIFCFIIYQSGYNIIGIKLPNDNSNTKSQFTIFNR